jgi:hypothetical protein
VITNRADREDTVRVDLPCRCPVPEPHAADSAQVVKLLSYGDRADIWQVGRSEGAERGTLALLLKGIVSWTLTLPDGKARPITKEELELLDQGTAEALAEALFPAWAKEPVPKGSGGRSPAGSPAKRSSTPRRKTPPPSTTS